MYREANVRSDNQLLTFFDLRFAFFTLAPASPFGGSSPAFRFTPTEAAFFTLTTVDLPEFLAPATWASAAVQSADASSIAYL
jgi:hypothetical protein